MVNTPVTPAGKAQLLRGRRMETKTGIMASRSARLPLIGPPAAPSHQSPAAACTFAMRPQVVCAAQAATRQSPVPANPQQQQQSMAELGPQGLPVNSQPGVSLTGVPPSAVPAAEGMTVTQPPPKPEHLPTGPAPQLIPAAVAAAAAAAPVMMCRTVTLPAEISLAAGLQALERAASSRAAELQGFASGVLRIEVAVPRGCTALRWLQGQSGSSTAVGQAVRHLAPHLYFSGRHSSAPDTPGTAQAERCTKGWSAIAGVGAAWLWQGRPGSGMGPKVMQQLQRFLSASSPNVRVIGGGRFNPQQQPSPEWEAFGSYCFALPLVEYVEQTDCCTLACTLAWDAAAAAAAEEAAEGGAMGAPAVTVAAAASPRGHGCASVYEAVAATVSALRSIQPPALSSAYALHLSKVEAPEHSPDRATWEAQMEGLLEYLQSAAATAAKDGAAKQQGGAAVDLGQLDRELAWQEYRSSGQQGLDELLAMALNSGSGADSASAAASALDAAAAAAADEAAEAAASGLGDWAGDEGLPEEVADGGRDGGVGGAAGELLMSKVVAARRTVLKTSGKVDPLYLLEAVQGRDPRAYQLYLGNVGGSTSSFLASTPERLYVRSGRFMASEAVAATRPRGAPGDVERDFWLALDLLNSSKDHVEFTLVRDWIAASLQPLASSVTVEVPKSVLKQGAVQHLYGRLAAELRPDSNDAHLLQALHPTPAVCGRPRELAMRYLQEAEPFDRGFYAGPFGWVSGAGAEFVVAIRSALVTGDAASTGSAQAGPSPGPIGPMGATMNGRHNSVCASAGAKGNGQVVSLYAGVGIVVGSDPLAEWQELDLKVRQYQQLLLPPRLQLQHQQQQHKAAAKGPKPPAAPSPAAPGKSTGGRGAGGLDLAKQAVQQAPSAGTGAMELKGWLEGLPNINLAWCSLLVEELCRHGVTMFCVAPGSRSSPLTMAIALHPRATLNVCIDERSLGFWALGYGRATGRPAAVITSSGTAVANLLPAAVEASLSHVPLLLLTADRPEELRATGANQTIDQVKIFGSFVRWAHDVAPPQQSVPGRAILTTAALALRYATSTPPGPVHLNLQFREPLAPSSVPWSPSHLLSGLSSWTASTRPYTTTISPPPSTLPLPQMQLGMGSGLQAAAPLVPEAQELIGLLAGAQRGLFVVGELLSPEDVVLTARLAADLSWPVAADVLSGLRVGATAGSEGAQVAHRGPASNVPAVSAAVVHHMDHVLLGGLEDRSWWAALKPDVILQIGAHATSKRLSQFLEWSAQDTSYSPPSTWIHVAPHAERHDAAHLITHRVAMGLPTLAALLSSPAALAYAAPSLGSTPAEGRGRGGAPGGGVGQYRALLLALDGAVSTAVDTALAGIPELNEPGVARQLARQLPAGYGLFLGNSMPIRDMEMYGCGRRHPGAGAGAAGQVGARQETSGPGPAAGLFGVPIAANRGASGIDGVLSTAAGFAEGLSQPVTLVVGDLSFLHDVNGLNLLRTREAGPPLTVLLINNAGGAIFSFLPIASEVPSEQFTPLWATPQNVDLEGMCRAHGIPHQRVTSPTDLAPALTAAWGLNRHSVVELVTNRSTNLQLHKTIQAAAQAAARATYRLLAPMNTLAMVGVPTYTGSSDAALAGQSPSSATGAPAVGAGLGAGAVAGAAILAAPLRVATLAWQRYELPLRRPLTTSQGAASSERTCIVVSVTLTSAPRQPPSPSSSTTSTSSSSPHDAPHNGHYGANQSNNANTGSGPASSASTSTHNLTWTGLGEVSPLPGLHAERDLHQAEAQLAMVSELLASGNQLRSLDGPLELPRTVAMLGGRLEAWLHQALGFHPSQLCPSVRFGLETAILNAIAAERGAPLAELVRSGSPASSSPSQGTRVLVNALVSAPAVLQPDEASVSLATKSAVMQAMGAVNQGYTCMKIKVARRPLTPEQDASLVCAVRAAVGPSIQLRADANRGWSLEEAVRFGTAAAAGGAALEYVEEPTHSPKYLQPFYEATGIPFAVDESLDDGSISIPGLALRSSLPASMQLSPAAAALAGAEAGEGSALSMAVEVGGPGSGLAAVVVKPSLLGSWEGVQALSNACSRLVPEPSGAGVSGDRGGSDAAAAATSGRVQVVVSSAFESSVGLAALAQLAAGVVDGPARAQALERQGQGAVHRQTAHGLGTLDWFLGDTVPQSLPCSGRPQQQQHQGTEGVDGVSISVRDAHAVGTNPFVIYSPQAVEGEGEGDGTRLCFSVLTEAGARYTITGLQTVPGLELEEQQQQQIQHERSPHPPGSNAAGRGDGSTSASDDSDEPCAAAGSSGAAGAEGAAAGQGGRETFVFLHGFLGSAEDWMPLMKALTEAGHRCIALDLPGHGGSAADAPTSLEGAADSYSISFMASAVHAVLVSQLGLQGAYTLVGYSMGARVAAALAARQAAAGAQASPFMSRLVLVSGSLGMQDASQARSRAITDDALACVLESSGLPVFLDHWYSTPMWESLRASPAFSRLLTRRAAAAAVDEGAERKLAAVLRAASPGRSEAQWDAFGSAAAAGKLPPTTLVVGALDHKYKKESAEALAMLQPCDNLSGSGRTGRKKVVGRKSSKGGSVSASPAPGGHKRVVVPGCGHAVHVEAPAALLDVLLQKRRA